MSSPIAQKLDCRAPTQHPKSVHLLVIEAHETQGQLVECGNFVRVLNQVPIDANGRLVDGGIEEKARAIFKEAEIRLQTAGSSLSQVIKVVVYVLDEASFNLFGTVYEEVFPQRPPQSMVLSPDRGDGIDVRVDFLAIRRETYG